MFSVMVLNRLSTFSFVFFILVLPSCILNKGIVLSNLNKVEFELSTLDISTISDIRLL